MKNVQPFIDLGWFLVPLDGVIKRLPNGKKTLPKFPNNWKSLYLEKRYEPKKSKESIALTGAIICGTRSGVVSIDCDNDKTLSLFKALDPDYEFIFYSKDKKEGGGSIIYYIAEEWEKFTTFRIKNDLIELDFQTNDDLQYLPTSGNKTKVEWKEKDLPELREANSNTVNLICVLHELHSSTKVLKTDEGQLTQAALNRHYKYLAPFIKSFLNEI